MFLHKKCRPDKIAQRDWRTDRKRWFLYTPKLFFLVVGVGCNKTSVFYGNQRNYINKKRWQWLTRTAFIKSLFIQNIFVTAKQDFVSYVNILSLLSKACQQSMKFYFFKSKQLFQTTTIILNGKMAN